MVRQSKIPKLFTCEMLDALSQNGYVQIALMMFKLFFSLLHTNTLRCLHSSLLPLGVSVQRLILTSRVTVTPQPHP